MTAILLGKLPRTTMDAKDLPSDVEIDKLPLEVRVCYHIQPWNTTFTPTSIEDWAVRLGWVLFRYSESGKLITHERSVQLAILEARRLYTFLCRELILITTKLKEENKNEASTNS